MIQIELDARMEAGVMELASELHIAADAVVKQAIEQMLEDRQDYLAGVHSLEQMSYTISTEEMERRSELAD